MARMTTQNIVLTGFMGTGKSAVGRLLAARLGYGFVDTDEVIVARSGRSISAIFQEQGETAFRQWEALIAQELAAKEKLVIATGGGFMLRRENAMALERKGTVFCLTAAPDELLARLAAEKDKRPLLAGDDPAGRIRQLLAQRAAGYGRFAQIDTTGKTVPQVVAEIMRIVKNKGVWHEE